MQRYLPFLSPEHDTASGQTMSDFSELRSALQNQQEQTQEKEKPHTEDATAEKAPAQELEFLELEAVEGKTDAAKQEPAKEKAEEKPAEQKSEEKPKEKPPKKKKSLPLLLASLLILAAAAFVGYCAYKMPVLEQQIHEVAIETIPAAEYAAIRAEELAAEHAAQIGAEAVDDGMENLRAYLAWQASLVAPSMGTVTLNSCRIEGGNVVVEANAKNILKTDDDRYVVIAQQMYESGNEGTEVASVTIEELDEAGDLTFIFPLNKNSDSSNLFRRFFVAAKYNGELIPVSAAKYVENPSACAGHTVARNDHGKKGILPSAALIRGTGLKTLGVQQALYNLPIGSLCSGGGINYTYNGKTYSFNASIVSQYDIVVPHLNSMGIQVTMVILNNSNGDASMLHPKARGGSSRYYAFNSAEQAGIEKLEAIASFLAERYSGTGHGTIDNWIIGNEINARADWHYMSDVGVDSFAQEYANAFRIFYNGIKSQNGNARIYISIDQQWARSINSAKYYSSKSFLQSFNSAVLREGDMDWHVAVHPYNVPLYDPHAWYSGSNIPHSQDAAYISMRNIDVLTDFLSQGTFLAPDGNVRSVLCSEVGYTSVQGEAVQAASVVYGYLQAMHNSHIDGFILSREQDDAGEIAERLANGLLDLSGRQKLAYSYYQAMGTANEQQYIDAAVQTMGIGSISEVLTDR